VAVPGILRLRIEVAIFGMAVWAFYNVKHTSLYLIRGVMVIVLYIVYYDRILWLKKH